MVLGLLDSFDRAEELMEIAEKGNDGAGAAMEAQEIWMESLSAKLQQLQSSVSQFWMAFLDSGAYGGIIEMLTNLVNLATKLVEKFGAIPSMVGTATAAFLTFNKTARTGLTDYLKSVTQAVSDQIAFNEVNGKTGGVAKVAMAAILGQKTATEGLSLSMVTAAAKTVALKLAAIGLQTALTLGISVAVTAVTTLIGKLIDKFKSLEDRIKSSSDALKDFGSSYDSYKETSDNLNRYGEITDQLENDNTLTYDKRQSLESELETITRALISSHSEYQAILENENLTLEEQLAIMEQLNKETLKEDAEAFDKKYSQKDIDKYALQLQNQANRYQTQQSTIDEMLKNGQTSMRVGQGVVSLDSLVENQEKLREDLLNTYSTLQSINSQILYINQDGQLIEATMGNISDETQGIVDGLMNVSKNASNATVPVVKMANQLDILNSKMGQSGKSAEELFTSAGKKLEDLLDLQEKFSGSDYNYSDLSDLLDLYPEIGTRISDNAYVQQFLNEKIKEMASYQEDAYAIMFENDATFFEEKVKNSDAYQQYLATCNNSIVAMDNFVKTQLAINGNKELQDFANLLNEKLKLAQQDLKNAGTIAEARAAIDENLITGMAGGWEAYYQQQFDKINEMSNSHDLGTLQEADEMWNQLQTMKSLYEGMANSFSIQIKVPTPTFKRPTASSASSSSSSSSTKQEVEDMELVIDRYLELNNVIDDLNNALKKNQQLQTYATPQDKLRLMREEISLYKQQQQAYEKLRQEQRKEADELKYKLQMNGFKFNGDELLNYSSQLTSLVNRANSKTGDAKEQAIEAVKDLEQAIEDFIDLTNSKLPSTTESWQEMADTIKELQREQLEYIADIQSQISDAIQQELEKQTEATKKELEKRRDLYDKEYNEENWQDELKAQQKVVDELAQQINDLSRDTSKSAQVRLEQLKEEYAQAMEDLNQMIRDKEHENGLDAFDQAISDLDTALENALDPENLADLVNQALSKGFVELNGVVYQTENLLHNMLTSTTDGFFALGQTLKQELIEGLEVCKTLFVEIGALASGLGSSVATSTAKARSLVSDGFNLPASYSLDGLTSSIQNFTQNVSISFDSLLSVDGNLDHTILGEVEQMLVQAKSEVVHEIATSLQTR